MKKDGKRGSYGDEHDTRSETRRHTSVRGPDTEQLYDRCGGIRIYKGKRAGIYCFRCFGGQTVPADGYRAQAYVCC